MDIFSLAVDVILFVAYIVTVILVIKEMKKK